MIKSILLATLSFFISSCAVKKVAPVLNENQLTFSKSQSSVPHDIRIVIQDNRSNKLHSSEISGFLQETYTAQLKKMGHSISNNSKNQLVLYLSDYNIELSGSICTTKAKFRYEYLYGKRMKSTHDIEDSESVVPCFSTNMKYESTVKLMNKMLKDFGEWFSSNNIAVKKIK